MADPTKYIPGFSYSGFQAVNPKKPLPADEVDNDLANVSRSINEAIDAIKDVRRSDGKLKNQSVGPDQLSPALSLGFTLRGTWVLGVKYSAGDGVVYNNAFYSARVTHVAVAENAPGNASFWNFLFSIDDLAVAGALAMPRNVFAGDGSQKQFTLTFTPVSALNLLVSVGGVVQAVSEYSVNGNELTFLTAPPFDYAVEIRAFATTADVITPVDGSVTFAKLDAAVQARIDELDVKERKHVENVVDRGADAAGVANSSAAFTASKVSGSIIRVPAGTFKLDNAYDLSSGVYEFDHGVFLKKPDGSQSDAGLSWLQVSGYLEKAQEIAGRSGGMVISPTTRVKLDSTSISGGGDETVLNNAILWYQRTATALGNGYSGGATLFSGFINYGAAGFASGSAAILGARYNVGDVKAEATGRNEHTPISSAAIALADKTQNKSNFYHDLVVSGPATVQEAFLAALVMTGKKLHATRTIDADHDGAYLFVAETSPLMGGFGAPMLTSFTMNGGGVIAGWAGPITTSSGYDAAATSAFERAFILGGAGGVWNPFGSHSKFDIGLSITDFVFTGIEIFTAHPHGSSQRAIHVFEDAGTTLLGINTISGAFKLHVGNGSGQFDNNARFYPTSHATSKRAGIQIGDWVVGQDRQGNGTKDFFLFDINGGAGNRFVIDVNGLVNLPAAGATVSIAGTQVLSARKTGWTAATGTATRTTFVTGSVTLPVLAEHVKALIDDLIAHGAIGT